MLRNLIILVFAFWIGGFFVNGLTLYNCMLLIPVIMFSIRKFGIHVKLGTICLVEILLLFFSTTWRLLFTDVVAWRYWVGLALRVLSILVAVYDDTVYVYVTEERKRL